MQKYWNDFRKLRFELALIPIVASILVFITSIILSKYCIAGDQKVYNEVYYFVRSMGWVDGYEYYCGKLSSIEVVHYAYIYLVAGVFDKDVAMALVNASISYLAALLLLKNGCDKWICLSVVLTNFYFFVLYFAAERLKFGVLFYLLSFTVGRFKILKLIFEVVSVLGHVQMLAIILPIRIYVYLDSRSFSKKTIITIFITLLLLISLFLTLQDQINPYLEKKVSHYSEVSDALIGCFKILIFMVMSTFDSKTKLTPKILAFAVLIGFILAVGGDRLVIFGFGMCLFWLIRVNRGLNYPLVILNIYYFNKTIEFIGNILKTGQGFDES